MAQAQEAVKPHAFEETTVVDLDVHVMSPKEVQKDKAERLPKPWKNVVDPDGASIVGAYPSSGLAVEIPGEWNGVTMAPEAKGLVDPEEDIQKGLCEEFGVDYPILNMGAPGVNLIPEEDRREKEMRATNDVLLDRFLDDHPDFYGVATVATTLPDKAAEEIDRLKNEKQIVGLYANSAYIDPPLGHPQHDVMYRAAEDAGFSFVLHSGVSSPHYPNLDRGVGHFLDMHSIGHPVSHMIQLVNLIYRGVPVKFPDVKFMFTESGLGWASYLMARMNREYAERRFEAPLLEKSPEEYVRSNCLFATQPLEEYNDPQHMRNTVDTLGPECIAYSSDYPHFDFDYPAMVNKYYEHLSQEDRDKIFHENAAEALNLPI